MNSPVTGLAGPERDHAHVEGVLARYPNIDPAEIESLTRWFKEASALDVAMVASNASIHDAYTQFRREHIDRFKPKDLAFALAFVALCAIAIAGIVSLGP